MSAIFIMESIMDHVARSLGLDVEQVKKENLYKQGDISYNVSWWNNVDVAFHFYSVFLQVYTLLWYINKNVYLFLSAQENRPEGFKLEHCNIQNMWDGECVCVCVRVCVCVWVCVGVCGCVCVWVWQTEML